MKSKNEKNARTKFKGDYKYMNIETVGAAAVATQRKRQCAAEASKIDKLPLRMIGTEPRATHKVHARKWKHRCVHK